MSMTRIPDSIREEHEEIFEGLRGLSKKSGEVGAAVRSLLQVLEPHFEREDEVAMPLLGAIAPMAEGSAGVGLDEVISLQERLSKEMKSMLKEHREIGSRIAAAKAAAQKDGDAEALSILKGLEHHARIEEEVLYPAAMLTGILARQARQAPRA